MIINKKNTKPIIIAMIGFVGSGKSNVARAIAKLINGRVVSVDDVRVNLRNKKQDYAKISQIIENIAIKTLKSGRSVILDSDFVDAAKRKTFEQKFKKLDYPVGYLRIYADRDFMIGRLISKKYVSKSLFGGASSNWKGKNKGAVVALREMWRRTLHHYRWSPAGGGRFILKRLPIKFILELDTSKNWRQKLKKHIKLFK